MHTLSQNLYLRFLKLFNLLIMTAMFLGMYLLYYHTRLPHDHQGPFRPILLAFLFAHFYVNLGKTYDGFLISTAKVSEIIYSQTLALLFTDFFCYVIVSLLFFRFVTVWPFILLVICQVWAAVAWSWTCNHMYFKMFPAKRTAIIYDNWETLDKKIVEYGMDKKFKVVKLISVQDGLENRSHELDGIEAVFISGLSSTDRNKILKYCVGKGLSIYVLPCVGDLLMQSAKPMHMFNLPVYRLSSYDPSPYYVIGKRCFDIVVSLFALIALSPVFLITAAAIKLGDGGPVFYKQERLTKGGKKFMIHKFRSMRVDAEKDGVARLSSGDNDDRITPVGHFIRKVRIDELPQLIDILKGDLSVVGPRPERESIALEYEKTIPEFRLRLQAKAGLTGYAQVYGKYNTTPYDKLSMDLMYIANPSFMEDLRICFATVKILFMPESTEGVEAGAVNALSAIPAKER